MPYELSENKLPTTYLINSKNLFPSLSFRYVVVSSGLILSIRGHGFKHLLVFPNSCAKLNFYL